MTRKIKFGFVFISHKAHLHHGAPVAFELSMDNRFDVHVYSSDKHNYELLNSIATAYPNHQCNIHLLKPSLFYTITRFFKNRIYPGIKEIFSRHYKEFSSCDALLSPHYNLDYLMDREKNIVYFNQLHGAGDYKIGYSKKLNRFDYILVSGTEIKERMIEEEILCDEKIKVIGYAKFDIINKRQFPSQNLFNNQNPIIQYVPHYFKHSTSWYFWGYHILDFFATHKEYNLIFTPHIKTFGKRLPKKLRQYETCENIIIDTQSDKLIDMTYTQLSDVYLGDISSQVYEFIYKPRPCVFLNPHQIDWKSDKFLKMWKLGRVLNQLEDLDEALKNAKADHQKYLPLQQGVMQQKFDPSDQPAGKRAAEVIAQILVAKIN